MLNGLGGTDHEGQHAPEPSDYLGLFYQTFRRPHEPESRLFDFRLRRRRRFIGKLIRVGTGVKGESFAPDRFMQLYCVGTRRVLEYCTEGSLSTVSVADAHRASRGHPTIRKVHLMSKRDNDADNAFRSSDRPLTEYEKEQKALRRNLDRLRAERLAREAANSKES